MSDNLSNLELRRALIKRGVRCGPVTDRTRAAYERKYESSGSSSYSSSSSSRSYSTSSYSAPQRQSQTSYYSRSYDYDDYDSSANRRSQSSALGSMSNLELRRTLTASGVSCGPVTDKTRNAYEQKYHDLQSGTRSGTSSSSQSTKAKEKSTENFRSSSTVRSDSSSALPNMSNLELRRELTARGVSCGPVTDKTRNAYEQKYLNLESSGAESSNKGQASKAEDQKNQWSSSSSTVSSSVLPNMSNLELRRELTARGVSCGPVTDKTRNAYEQKYLDLESSGAESSNKGQASKAEDQKNQWSSSSSTVSLSALPNMSNLELRRELTARGVSCGPVTDKTRNAYEQKYLDLESSGAESSNKGQASKAEDQKNQWSSSSSTVSSSALPNMSNLELRRELTARGVSCGPVTDKTRNAYEQKYLDLESSSAESSNEDQAEFKKNKETSSSSTVSSSALPNMSNLELRRELTARGISCGPITDKTRNAYEKKYLNLESAGPVSSNNGKTEAKQTHESTLSLKVSPSALKNMSHLELRRKLTAMGVSCGPITDKTRSSYEQKYLNADSTSTASDPSASKKSTAPVSGSDSSESGVTSNRRISPSTEKTSVVNLSNAELRRVLLDHGVRVGPITKRTRNAYEKKYLNLIRDSQDDLDELSEDEDSLSEDMDENKVSKDTDPADVLSEDEDVPPPTHPPPPPPIPRMSAVEDAYRSSIVKSQDAEFKACGFENISCEDNIMKIKCTPNQVLNKLYESRKSKDSYDVVIKAGGVTLPAHKQVLKSFSPYFEAHIDRWQDAKNDGSASVIQLNTIDTDTIVVILDFAYSQSVKVTSADDVLALLEAAHYLQVEPLCKACCAYFGKALNSENWLNTWSRAGLYLNDIFKDTICKLVDRIKAFVIRNFSTESRKADILTLECNDLIGIIRDDALDVGNEQAVFDFVLRWFNHNKKDRLSELSEVLNHVRLVHMDVWYLRNRLEKEGAITACQSLLEEVIKYHQEPHKRCDVLSSIRRSRYSSQYSEVMLVHDECSETKVQTLGLFTPNAEKINYLPFPGEVSRNINASTFYDGGFSDYTNTVLSSYNVDEIQLFDFSDNVWKPAQPLSKIRHSYGLCQLNGSWYAVGGEKNCGGDIVDTVEKYDVRSNSWKEVAPLPTPLSDPSVVSYGGALFILGGFKCGNVPSNKVYQYKPLENTWSTVSTLPVELNHCSACVLDGNIYVCFHQAEADILVYNISSKTWGNIEGIPHKVRFGPIVINGDIYVLARDSQNFSLIMRYSPFAKSWNEFAAFSGFQPQLFSGPFVMKRPQKSAT